MVRVRLAFDWVVLWAAGLVQVCSMLLQFEAEMNEGVTWGMLFSWKIRGV